MSKCRHKKLILATADLVRFSPDQEPFESGKIECTGISAIVAGVLVVHYCPKCKQIADIEIEQGCQIYTESCTERNRCNGH